MLFRSAASDASAAPDLPTVAAHEGPLWLGLTPDHGSHTGLTTVTIHGAGLLDVQQVRFGDTEGLDLQVLDDQTLTVRTPPHPAGEVDVVLRAPGYPDAVLPDGFRFVAPVELAKVLPAHGPAQGGSVVTIQGAGCAAKIGRAHV